MRLWQQVEEVGGPLAMRMTFILLKTLPYALLVLIAIPVSFFYWVIDGKGRKAVASYLESIGRINGRKYHSYPLFLSFGLPSLRNCVKIACGAIGMHPCS